ncbi:MAG: hypothetical protein INH41_21045 [Myxococcaceae bacterium]|jgi:hypothetical protein|nr:hypothetical protein [Myxococcaceae bacterium]MCA3014880.1 hypothetical protein [Myxococcaceae bacterium]
MSSTAVVQLQQREVFERNVTRSLVAGAAAGVLGWLVTQRSVPAAFFPLVAVALACVRGKRLERVLLMGAAVTLPALPWLLRLTQGWTVALAGAIAGALVVKGRLAETGDEHSVGASRPGPWHWVAAATVTGGLAVAGLTVAETLVPRLQALNTPSPLVAAVSGAIVALFAGLGSLASHVALKADPVEARGDEVLPTLDGEFATQLGRALGVYRQCGRQLAELPREAAREELARTVGRLTKDAIDLAAEWAGVESHLHDDAHRDLKQEIDELKQSASKARDAVAKRQLELAAESLHEELERLGEMRLKRERVLAKLKSQVALLERARVALIGMRSSHATVRAAEMSAVARKLNALATAQADEAKLAHAVATSAEIAALEAQRSDAATAKSLTEARATDVSVGPARTEAPEPAPFQPAPVTSVAAPADDAAHAPGQDKQSVH